MSDAQSVTSYTVLEGTANSWSSCVGSDEGPQPLDSNGCDSGSPLPACISGAKSTSLTGRYYRFYGAASATPTNSAQVRALPASAFQTSSVNVFSLNTGAALTKFSVALPPARTVTSVFDLDALCADITSQYVCLGTISVNDGGGTGTARTYNLYEMNVGSPYSASHAHQITTG